MPAGVATTRFSTEPSSATSTASALSGSRRTNSMCFSRTSSLLVSTTPAPRVRSDSRLVVSGQRALEAAPSAAARTWRSMRARSSSAETAELEQRVDVEAQAAAAVGSRPALVCGA